MRAEVGDEVEVGSAGPPQPGRIGTIVAVQGGGDAPHYLVHWLADYESLISPRPASQVRPSPGMPSHPRRNVHLPALSHPHELRWEVPRCTAPSTPKGRLACPR